MRIQCFGLYECLKPDQKELKREYRLTMRNRNPLTDDTCDMEFATEVWFARFTLKFGKGLAPKWDVEKLCFFSKVGEWFEDFHTFGYLNRVSHRSVLSILTTAHSLLSNSGFLVTSIVSCYRSSRL